MSERHPLIEAFRQAARAAVRVRAQRSGHAVLVLPERREAPGPAVGDAAGVLVEALRQAYGDTAADVACSETGIHRHPGAVLDSRRVLQAITCAAAVQALDEGRLFGLRLSYSAALGGHGFKAECRRCGVDPETLSDARCEAIDAEMAGLWCDSDLDPADAAALLCAVLRRRAH